MMPGLSTFSKHDLMGMVVEHAESAEKSEAVSRKLVGIIRGMIGDLYVTGALSRDTADTIWSQLAELEQSEDQEDE